MLINYKNLIQWFTDHSDTQNTIQLICWDEKKKNVCVTTNLIKLCMPFNLFIITNPLIKITTGKKTNTSFSKICVFYLFVIFLSIIQLTKAKRPLTLACSIVFLFCLFFFFSPFLLYNKKTCYICCVKLFETCYSTCISLHFCWFFIASIVLICKSLWIKASAKWHNVNVNVILTFS